MRQVGLIFEKGVGKKVDKTVKRPVKPAQPTKTKTDKPANGEKPAQPTKTKTDKPANGEKPAQ